MRRLIKRSSLLLGGLLIGLSAWLGSYWAQHNAGIDLWCSGRGAQWISDERWLSTRFSLGLSADGRGHLRILARLLASDQMLNGQMHRDVAFSYRLRGQRLLLKVDHSGASESDNLSGKQLPMAHLAVLGQGAELSVRLRRLSDDLYLLDNEVGQQQLCRQTRESTPGW